MLTPLEIKNKLTEMKPVLSQRFNVQKIGYFGSFASNTANPDSDLDILVEFSEPVGWEFFDLEEFLEKAFNRKVDLVTPNALKPQIKNSILKQVVFV
jgi:predicted nucleotidyltransferase